MDNKMPNFDLLSEINNKGEQLLPKGQIANYLNTAVAVTDRDLKITYLNSSAEAFFGTSEQHCMNTPLYDLLVENGAPALDGLLEVFNTGQTVTKRAATFRMRDGRQVYADFTASVDPAGTALLIELQPMNRFIRINREDHSTHSQKTSKHLIRGLAHEIKNPLGGLRGAAQLLEHELIDPTLHEYTQVIIEEADRLTDLVDRMLGPNKISKKKEVNLHESLERVIRIVDAELPGKIDFKRDYDPSLPSIMGDQAQLVQALMNLMRNAGQALSKTNNAKVLVKTRAVRKFTIGNQLHRLVAQVDIIDNGPGVPDEMMERMWFPMVSGQATGTGLGLSITQTIIGQHGGSIECLSKPGETCFSVFIPLELKLAGDMNE
tara:strand:+ start:679 stop:1809 length:1131 start_codon:yes stop_codon:yes gene_type:complete